MYKPSVISFLHGISFFSLVFLLSGCETVKKIDQGLYDITNATTEKDQITGARTLSFADREKQIQDGNRAVEQIIGQARQQGVGVNEQADPRAYQRLQKIFSRIHAVSHYRQENWQPILLGDPSFNAFTTGGTYIVVFTGLMEQVKNDGELAAVIAHEIAHTAANHPFENQSHKVVSSLTGSESVAREGFQAAFTHEQEREADRIGVLYCALAGYDPAASSKIWDRMYDQRGNNRMFFADHPVNSERAAEIRQTAYKVKGYYSPGKVNPDFESLLMSNALYRKSGEAEIKPGEGGGFLAALETAANTYVTHQKAKEEEERQRQHIAFIQQIMNSTAIVRQGPSNTNSWYVQLRYQEAFPLQKISVGALFLLPDNQQLQLVKHIEGNIQTGVDLNVEFTDQKLPARQMTTDKVRIYIDDAVPQ